MTHSAVIRHKCNGRNGEVTEGRELVGMFGGEFDRRGRKATGGQVEKRGGGEGICK